MGVQQKDEWEEKKGFRVGEAELFSIKAHGNSSIPYTREMDR